MFQWWSDLKEDVWKRFVQYVWKQYYYPRNETNEHGYLILTDHKEVIYYLCFIQSKSIYNSQNYEPTIQVRTFFFSFVVKKK